MAYSYKKYEESDVIKRAQQRLQDNESLKPGEYQSKWQGQLDDTMSKITNRKPFQYDVSRDALYNQYKDQYVHNGKLAMQDTMGQAAALTGGYGNSYAQSVGQQAYQNYLTGLTDKIPELYQLALSKYQLDGDALKDQYALLSDRENQDYGRHKDAVAAWQTDRSYLAGRYDQERTWDYGKYTDDRNYDYTVWQDNAARAQAQVEYLLSIGVNPSDDLLEASGLSREYSGNRIAQWQAAQAAAAAEQEAARGSGGGKRKSNGNYQTFMEYMNDVNKQVPGGISSDQAAALITQAAKEGLIKKEDQLNYMMIYG